MNKQLWSLFFALAAMVFLPDAAFSKMIAISDFNAVPYNEAFKGMLDIIPDLERLDINNDAQKIASLSAGSTDRIICIGSEAVGFSKRINPDIPMTYTMVLSPWSDSKRSVSGITIKLSILDQLKMIKKIFPNRTKVGVVYYPEDSSTSDINEARQVCSQFNFTILPIAVQNKDEIPVVLSKFTPESVDVIWMVLSPVTCSLESVKAHIAQSLKTNLPLVGISPFHAKAGALLAFSADYYDIGTQAASMAMASGLSSKVETPRKIAVFVNPTTQKQLVVADMVLPPSAKIIQ